MTMLAVVLILPIAIIVVACLLERFEARAVSADPSRRALRADRHPDLRTPPAPRLTLVPEPEGSARGRVGLDAPTADLRRAS
jgi:hypothetical protein